LRKNRKNEQTRQKSKTGRVKKCFPNNEKPAFIEYTIFPVKFLDSVYMVSTPRYEANPGKYKG
jgi:hypothetical protein